MLEKILIQCDKNQCLRILPINNNILHKMIIEVYKGSSKTETITKRFVKGSLSNGYTHELAIEAGGYLKITTSIPENWLEISESNFMPEYQSQYQVSDIPGYEIYTLGNIVTAEKRVIVFGLTSQSVRELFNSFDELCIIAINADPMKNIEEIEKSVRNFILTVFDPIAEKNYLEITTVPQFSVFKNSQKLIYCLTSACLEKIREQREFKADLIVKSEQYELTKNLTNRIFYFHELLESNVINYSIPLIRWLLASAQVEEKIFRYEKLNWNKLDIDFKLYTNAAVLKNKKMNEVMAFIAIVDNKEINKYIYIYKKTDEEGAFKYLVPTKKIYHKLVSGTPKGKFGIQALVINDKKAVQGFVYEGKKILMIDGNKTYEN